MYTYKQHRLYELQKYIKKSVCIKYIYKANPFVQILIILMIMGYLGGESLVNATLVYKKLNRYLCHTLQSIVQSPELGSCQVFRE